MPAQTVIKLRRDTSDNWWLTNPVLDAGEIGFLVDTTWMKVGDGLTTYQNLPFAEAYKANTANFSNSANSANTANTANTATTANTVSALGKPNELLFLSTGNSQRAAWSTDGITWSYALLPFQGSWQTSYGSGVFVSVPRGPSFSTTFATSTNGLTWTQRTLPTGGFWNSSSYGNGVFVFVEGNSSNVAIVSTDGITWIQSSLPVAANWNSVTYGNGIFVAVTSDSYVPDSYSAVSTDGISWTLGNLPASVEPKVAYGDGKFVLISKFDSQYQPTNLAYTSTNGLSWAPSSLPVSALWGAVTYGNSLFIALSASGGLFATSQDGITWSYGSFQDTSIAWSGITYSDGKFVAIGVSGTSGRAATSLNGTVWTLTNLPFAPSPYTATQYQSLIPLPNSSSLKKLTGELSDLITATTYSVGPYDRWINLAVTATHAMTLPNPALNKNRELVIKNTTPFAVNSASANVKPLNSQTVGTSILVASPGKYAKMVSDGTHWIIMEAN